MRAQEHCAEACDDASADQVSDGGTARDGPGGSHRTGPRGTRAVAGPGGRLAGGAATTDTCTCGRSEAGTVAVSGGTAGGPAWWRRDRMEVAPPRQPPVRAVSLPAAPPGRATAVNLPPSAGS